MADRTPIYARDGSPAAIAEAFERQRAAMRLGPLGPIGIRTVMVPIAGRLTAPSRTATAARRTPAKPCNYIEAIRASRYAVAGYAARYNTLSHRNEMIQCGAFTGITSVVPRRIFLLLNHEGADQGQVSIASCGAGTLYIEEDRRGLWFEAALSDQEGPHMLDALRRGAVTGCSWAGEAQSVTRDHVHVFTRVDAWEISVLVTPRLPRLAGTWVAPHPEAVRRRTEMMHER